MPKLTLLRLHRWIALAFTLPLLIVIGSGLLLAFEPALKARTPDGTVTLARLEAIIAAAGPAAHGGGLFVRGYDGTATIGRRGQTATYALASAEPAEPSALASAFRIARPLHETMLLGLGWLVTASTIALVALAPLGLLLGWPRLRNTLSGWHRWGGWVLLPLLVGSPLTGLALVFGITFTPAPPRDPGVAPPLVETLRAVATRHDLDGLDYIRPMPSGVVLVRVLDGSGTVATYRSTAEGLQPVATNWPRVLHEGNWGGVLGSLANIVAALGLVALLVTGALIWLRRSLARRRARRARAALSAA